MVLVAATEPPAAPLDAPMVSMSPFSRGDRGRATNGVSVRRSCPLRARTLSRAPTFASASVLSAGPADQFSDQRVISEPAVPIHADEILFDAQRPDRIVPPRRVILQRLADRPVGRIKHAGRLIEPLCQFIGSLGIGLSAAARQRLVFRRR